MEDTKKRIRQREISIRYIDRPVNLFIKHNISPNTISFIGFMCSLVASFLIAIGWMYFSIWLAWTIPFFFGIASVFDLFDGEVARKTNKETQTGAFLDSNLDRLSDAMVILGLIYGGLINYILGYIIFYFLFFILLAEIWFYFITYLIIGDPFTIFIPIITRIPVTPIFLIFIVIYTLALVSTVIKRLYYTFKTLKNLNSYEEFC